MYCAIFHLCLRYGILFWGGDGESKIIFKLQKRVMRLIRKVGRGTSCRVLFKTLNILPLSCMYVMETVYYIEMNIGMLEQNSARHSGVPRYFFGGVQQIQLRTEGRKNGDLVAVAP
jgi:hypothetical protein